MQQHRPLANSHCKSTFLDLSQAETKVYPAYKILIFPSIITYNPSVIGGDLPQSACFLSSFPSLQATEFVKKNIVLSSGFVGGFLLGLAS